MGPVQIFKPDWDLYTTWAKIYATPALVAKKFIGVKYIKIQRLI